ncbi:MAG: hypothetical protein FWE11_06135 [Defluviitaleaceae bacterium]|nr:hypothetical protein [Defluviitaleaceae bacterium]
MESKVILYDANDTEIGETYSRRARQLVKQQRAIWADDTHTAIKFMPDQTEEWEEPQEPAKTHTPSTSGALYTLAEKRIKDRRQIILHSIFFIPGYFIISLLWMIATNGRLHHMSYLTMGFAYGAWTIAYFSHLRNFIKTYNYKLKPEDWERRRRNRLEAEVDRLKRMGYSD